MANTVIALKKSAIPSATPAALANGELAINYADGKIFYKAANGAIVSFAQGGPSYGTVNANGTLVVAATSGDILTLVPGDNISITADAITDKITISASGGSIAPAFDQANAAYNKANSTTYTSNVVISTTDNTNAALRITQTGTGRAIVVEDSSNPDSSPFVVDANGSVGIGGIPSNHRMVILGGLTGGTDQRAVEASVTVASDVTAQSLGFLSIQSTQNSAFTLSSLKHFSAYQGTFGSLSTVTNQWGFLAESNLTGATNNYGFYGNIPSGTGRWNFYAAGTASNYFAGNVGIATNAPTNALQVVGTVKASSQLYVGSNSDDNYSGGIQNLSNTSRSISLQADPTNTGASTIMTFGIDGIERMRIDADGDVGIGTTAPLGSPGYGWLTINGSSNGAIMSLSNNNIEQFRIQSWVSATAINNITAKPLLFLTTNVERMRISDTGFVGIGGINPTSNLHVSGTANITSSLTVGTMNVVPTVQAAFNEANNAETIAIAAFGKANSTTYTSNVVISTADNTNAALRITQTGTGNALVVEDSANPDSTPFVVDANGNVGIGTTTANAKLDVAGVVSTSSPFYENSTTVSQNYTINTGRNAMSAGPITINSGVTVTVPSGSVWTIV